MALSIASLLSRSKSGGILITLGPAEPRDRRALGRGSTYRTYLQEPLFRIPCPFPGARLLSPAEAPLDGGLIWRIRWPFRRIPVFLACWRAAARSQHLFPGHIERTSPGLQLVRLLQSDV
jgi:hypothetical protein